MSSSDLSLQPIAIFEHDYHARSPLYSWPPTPSDELKQGEALALRMFGAILKDIRSPQHPYFAAWRDPDPASFAETEHDQPPTSILFNAQFGLAPREMSAPLVEAAEMFARLDRARLRLDMVRNDAGMFRVDGLELEINDVGSQKGRHFRSCWKGDEIADLDLSLQFEAPATRTDPFKFHIRGRLPRRYNRGQPIEREHVAFTVSGGAMPLPPWVNY